MFRLFPVLQSTSICQAYIYTVLQPIKEGIIIKSLRLSELWKPSSLFLPDTAGPGVGNSGRLHHQLPLSTSGHVGTL